LEEVSSKLRQRIFRKVAYFNVASYFMPPEQSHWQEALNFLGIRGWPLEIVTVCTPAETVHTLLKSADVIYIEGGNPSFLMWWLERNNLTEALREKILSGTPTIGASAGAMVLGQSVAISKLGKPWAQPLPVRNNMSGLGILPESIWPHYGRKWWHPALRPLARTMSRSPVLRLRDGEFHYYNSVTL